MVLNLLGTQEEEILLKTASARIFSAFLVVAGEPYVDYFPGISGALH